MLKKLKATLDNFKRELKVHQLVLKDPRTPKVAKALLGFAIGYAISPIDLIPDFIPIIGHVDDLVIVPLLIALTVKMVPRKVMNECRAKAQAQ